MGFPLYAIAYHYHLIQSTYIGLHYHLVISATGQYILNSLHPHKTGNDSGLGFMFSHQAKSSLHISYHALITSLNHDTSPGKGFHIL